MKKGSKKVLVLIVFLFVLLLATYGIYDYYTKNIAVQALKCEAFQKLANNDLDFFVNNELYENILKRAEKNNYETSSNIKLSTTMENNMFSDLDLSKFEFIHNFSRLADTEKTYNQVQMRYASNHLLTFDFIITPEQFAIKSDEIVNKYVGLEKKNAQNIANQINGTPVDFAAFRKLKNFTLDRENIDLAKVISEGNVEPYKNQIKDSFLKANVTKNDNVVLTLDSEKLTATEYTIELDGDQSKELALRNCWGDFARRATTFRTCCTKCQIF